MLDRNGHLVSDETEIKELDFFAFRLARHLYRAEIFTVGQLLDLSDEYILSIKSIGSKSLLQINDFKDKYKSEDYKKIEKAFARVLKPIKHELNSMMRQIRADRNCIDNLQSKIERIYSDFYCNTRGFLETSPKIKNVYDAITQHSIGIQNVYNKFIELELRQKDIEALLKGNYTHEAGEQMLGDKRDPEDWTIFTENMREASDENLQKALNSIRVVMEITETMQNSLQIMKQTGVVDAHDDERDKANKQIYEDGVRSIEIIEAEIARRKASSVV